MTSDANVTASNMRTPSSMGIGASDGKASKAARAAGIPCCHRFPSKRG